MGKEIDMQFMRYINLFEKICHTTTSNCFVYNHHIVFAVPKSKVSNAIGRDGIKIRKVGEILRKKIKVIEMAQNLEDINSFVSSIIAPLQFTKIEIKPDGEMVISATKQNKAALIGRNRAREQELEGILKRSFKITKLRIA